MASRAVPLGSVIDVHALSVQMEVTMCAAYAFKSRETDARYDQKQMHFGFKYHVSFEWLFQR